MSFDTPASYASRRATSSNASYNLLVSALPQLRASRGFDVVEVAGAKIGRLARWFAREQLDAAVIGASGGVDSSLVLALACAARIKHVVALVMPIEGRGATRQAEATARGRAAATAVGAEIWEAPLGDALAATIAALSRASGLAFAPWAEGQCLSVMRTPALDGTVALLRAHGHRAVVLKTCRSLRLLRQPSPS